MSYLNPSSSSDRTLERLPQELVNGLNLSERDRQTVTRGRSIIADGSKVTSVFLISEGWAVSKLSIGTGDTQILDVLGSGSIAGMSRIADTGLNGYSAIALQDVSLYQINLRALNDLAAQDEAVSKWLTDELSHQVQRTQIHIAALGQLPARGRLAFAMLRILDVAQQTGESMVGKSIRLPITQEEIGNMLGLTNVSISKLMSAFRREGLIDYARNRIVVQNVEGLSEICGVHSETLKTDQTKDFGNQFKASGAAQSAQ